MRFLLRKLSLPVFALCFLAPIAPDPYDFVFLGRMKEIFACFNGIVGMQKLVKPFAVEFLHFPKPTFPVTHVSEFPMSVDQSPEYGLPCVAANCFWSVIITKCLDSLHNGFIMDMCQMLLTFTLKLWVVLRVVVRYWFALSKKLK